MTMRKKVKKKQFCIHGHDVFICGRTNGGKGNCKICDQIYSDSDHKRSYRNFLRRLAQKFVNCIKDKPCMDCGIKYPSYVMQFDHRPGEKKLFSISSSSLNYNIEKIKLEITKCDVVCANCHWQRTHDRKFIIKRKNKGMKKLLKRVLKRKIFTQTDVSLLIQKLADPKSDSFDPEFAAAMQEEYDKRIAKGKNK
jgi:hypothetical protein